MQPNPKTKKKPKTQRKNTFFFKFEDKRYVGLWHTPFPMISRRDLEDALLLFGGTAFLAGVCVGVAGVVIVSMPMFLAGLGISAGIFLVLKSYAEYRNS
jgi:hypothetical protein